MNATVYHFSPLKNLDSIVSRGILASITQWDKDAKDPVPRIYVTQDCPIPDPDTHGTIRDQHLPYAVAALRFNLDEETLVKDDKGLPREFYLYHPKRSNLTIIPKRLEIAIARDQKGRVVWTELLNLESDIVDHGWKTSMLKDTDELQKFYLTIKSRKETEQD